MIKFKLFVSQKWYTRSVRSNVGTQVENEMILTPWKVILWSNPPPFWNFLGLWPPHPPGISNSLCGGSLDIFWNHTFQNIDCFKDKVASITGMVTFSTVNPENFSLIPLYHPENKANLWLPNTLRLDGHPFCVWLVKSCISGSWTVRSLNSSNRLGDTESPSVWCTSRNACISLLSCWALSVVSL